MLHNSRQEKRREEQRIRAAEQALKRRRLGVYLHIPFCRSKCDYCDFYSIPGREAEMEAYVAALCAHITEAAPYIRNYTIDTVYLGGGTPSFLGEKRLVRLLKTVQKELRPAQDCEVTLECNPDSVSLPLLRAVARCGVNRISMGVQSAQEDELKAVHRPHTFAEAREAVALVRKAKLPNLNLDLIYGLPGQSRADWQASVEAVLALKPDHLSLYGLQVEEGTPLYRKRATLDLADEDELADRYLWAVKRLAEAGYRQYEISNFALPGRESRHNLKYWRLAEYAGFGAGAHSDLGGQRYSYLRDVTGYTNGVLHGGALLEEQETISLTERASEYLMLGLRTTQGVSAPEYRRYRGRFEPIEAKLREFAAHGWAVQDGERWRLTPEGFLVSNQLIGLVLEAQEARPCTPAEP